jgi:hypothetical protein
VPGVRRGPHRLSAARVIARLCELATEVVREAENEYRLADNRDAAILLGCARVFAGEVTIYVERLKLRGAQVGTLPAKGEDNGS